MNKLPPGKYPLLPVLIVPRGAWSQGAAAGQCCAEEEGWQGGVSRLHGCVCTAQAASGWLHEARCAPSAPWWLLEPRCCWMSADTGFGAAPAPEAPRALRQICLWPDRAPATGGFVTVLGKLFKTQTCHSSMVPKQL